MQNERKLMTTEKYLIHVCEMCKQKKTLVLGSKKIVQISNFLVGSCDLTQIDRIEPLVWRELYKMTGL